MKLSTNIQNVSGYCSKGFQGQKSKVKVMVRPSSVLRRLFDRVASLLGLFTFIVITFHVQVRMIIMIIMMMMMMMMMMLLTIDER